MDRIIIVGRNDQIPRNAMRRLVVCGNCGGTGHDYGYDIDPGSKPFKVPCSVCDGQGAREVRS